MDVVSLPPKETQINRFKYINIGFEKIWRCFIAISPTLCRVLHNSSQKTENKNEAQGKKPCASFVYVEIAIKYRG